MTTEPTQFTLTRPLAFVDTEWTDLDPERRRIISIAICRLEPDGTTRTVHWLVRPGLPVSPASTRIHGLTDADLAEEPEFREIADQVEELLQDADIAGYGVAHDIEMIEREMAIAGRRWTGLGRHIVDAHRLWQVREPRSLADAHRRFVGPVPEDARLHDAMHDVLLSITVIQAMSNGRSVDELHHEAHADSIDPAGKFRLEDGKPVYNFGPFRGSRVSQNPEYLGWMLSRAFAPSTIETVHRLRRELHNDDED